MKKTSLLLAAAILITSCEKSEFNQLQYGNAKTSQVAILTRGAVSAPLSYPVSVYAFHSNGTLGTSQTISSPEEQISLSLYSGQDYRIVAVAAPTSDYSIADVSDLSSELSVTSSEGIAENPMQWGSAEIVPSAEKSTVAIQMGQKMASMEISLSDLPTGCTEVSVSVQSVSKSMTLNGECKGSQTAHIKCVREGEVWKSPTRYILPSTAEQTVFTIAYKNDETEHFCSVTYLGQLLAGTPYNISGKFTDGTMEVTGEISASGWADAVNLNFQFGPDISPTINSESGEGGQDTYTVSQMPGSGSLWEGHVVAICDTTSATTATLTLLSLSDWGSMTSSTNTSTPNMAASTAAGYQEFGLGSWRIPSEDEGRALFSAYNNYPLAQVMSDAGGDEIVLTEKSENVRYLCQDASRTYSFKVNTIINAGGTAKNYHLRLVRKVDVRIAQ